MNMKNIAFLFAAILSSSVFNIAAMMAMRGGIGNKTSLAPYTLPGRMAPQPATFRRKLADNNRPSSQDSQHGFIGKFLEKIKKYFTSKPSPKATVKQVVQGPVAEKRSALISIDNLKPGDLSSVSDPYLQWIAIQSSTGIQLNSYLFYYPLFNEHPEILRDLHEIQLKKDELYALSQSPIKRTTLYRPENQTTKAYYEKLASEIVELQTKVNKLAREWRDSLQETPEQSRERIRLIRDKILMSSEVN